jgi:hypothetical protein
VSIDDRPAGPTLKARLRALAGKVVRRLIPHVDGFAPADRAVLQHHDRALSDIFPALQAAQATVTDLEGRLAAIEEHMPAFLNTISSTAGSLRSLKREHEAFGDRITWLEEFRKDIHPQQLENLASGIRESWARIELIRAETLLELRYGREGTAATDAVADPHVVDETKVGAALDAGSVRLNLGCGHLPIDGYLNVDSRELPGVDVVAGVDQLPFDKGQVTEIFSAHMLEHFPRELLVRRLLPYWFELLAPGGELRAVVPDGRAHVEGYTRGDVPESVFQSIVYGGQEYEGDFHFSLFNADSLSEILAGAGFVDVTVEAEGRMNDVCPELQIVARRPS